LAGFSIRGIRWIHFPPVPRLVRHLSDCGRMRSEPKIVFPKSRKHRQSPE
jgi:hypothetical protein